MLTSFSIKIDLNIWNLHIFISLYWQLRLCIYFTSIMHLLMVINCSFGNRCTIINDFENLKKQFYQSNMLFDIIDWRVADVSQLYIIKLNALKAISYIDEKLIMRDQYLLKIISIGWLVCLLIDYYMGLVL